LIIFLFIESPWSFIGLYFPVQVFKVRILQVAFFILHGKFCFEIKIKNFRCHSNFAPRIYQAIYNETLFFGTASNDRNILILSVMNRKQDGCTASDDHDSKWEEKHKVTTEN
jgi:hypothetical protein